MGEFCVTMPQVLPFCCGLLLKFIIEKTAKFQFDISKNKYICVYPSYKIHRTP